MGCLDLVFPLIITMSAPGEHIPLHDWENTTADVVLQIKTFNLKLTASCIVNKFSRFIVITYIGSSFSHISAQTIH